MQSRDAVQKSESQIANEVVGSTRESGWQRVGFVVRESQRFVAYE